ncbi:MAG: hypothetical protein EOP33_09465, partial [Rickettsiaceae bacterium]
MNSNALNQGKLCSWLPTKTLLIMKIITFIMFAVIMQASAHSYSQITIHQNNTSVTKVLSIIKKQTGFVFLIKDYDLSKVKVNLNLNNVDVKEVLDACFKGLPITYKIVDKTVFILVKEKPSVAKTAAVSFQTITGRVTDEKGQPLPGATISVKNTRTAVAANIDGYFTITNVSPP